VVLVVVEPTPLIRVLPEVLVEVRERTLLAPTMLLLLVLQIKDLLEERQGHSLLLPSEWVLVVVELVQLD
jgi:hypothetical protein